MIFALAGEIVKGSIGKEAVAVVVVGGAEKWPR